MKHSKYKISLGANGYLHVATRSMREYIHTVEILEEFPMEIAGNMLSCENVILLNRNVALVKTRPFVLTDL